NPIIVNKDADLRLALEGVLWGAFGTTGQRCTAASRVILHRKIAAEFTRKLVAAAKALRMGNGLLPRTDLGPLVNASARHKVSHYVELGKEEGAKLLCGGTAPKGTGYFFLPTIFSNATMDMRLAREEIFGPVLSVIEAASLDEAIDLANAVEYGLSSALYTRDVNAAFRAIERLETGITYVNSSTIGAEVHLPFGGVKGSGTAREGSAGIEEFTEVKTVYIDYSGKLQKAQMD
ncbi:MAG TPA: aldehyde dehydrogenase family protein, partial [archaeon]|nr:aldehyde dehydrogenase family protein [archaeon]